jgi:hypothetical protein
LDNFNNISWLRHTTYTIPGTSFLVGSPSLSLSVTFKGGLLGLQSFGAAPDHYQSTISLGVDLRDNVFNPATGDVLEYRLGTVTPVLPTDDSFLVSIIPDPNAAPSPVTKGYCAVFNNGFSSNPGDVCFAIDVVKDTTVHGKTPFHLENIIYSPPGALSTSEYGHNYTVDSSTTWQSTDKYGVTFSDHGSLEVKAGVTFKVGFTDAEQDEAETISGGGIGWSKTMGETRTLEAGSDIASGLWDRFFLVLGIPTQTDTFSDGSEQRLTFDYSNTTSTGLDSNNMPVSGPISVIMTGQQLLAIADVTSTDPNAVQSSQAVKDLLQWPDPKPTLNDFQRSAIFTYLSPANAKAILLFDPSFFVTSNGQLAIRNPAQLRQWLDANPDRFHPLQFDFNGYETVASPPTTAMVPSGPVDGEDVPAGTLGTQVTLSNATSSSTIKGSGNDTQDSFSVDSQDQSVGITYEEEYQRVVTTTTTNETDDAFSLGMKSPCLTGEVEIYYDNRLGTYVFVGHDYQLAPSPVPEGEMLPQYYVDCMAQNFGSPDRTACDADSDCASQNCVDGVCTAPNCLPAACELDRACACDLGSACGLSGHFGDCASGNCSGGFCAMAMYLMECVGDGDCITGSCGGGTCGLPACSPNCQQGAGCGVDADCTSGLCALGTCVACSPTCAEGAACSANADCASGTCTNGVCAPWTPTSLGPTAWYVASTSASDVDVTNGNVAHWHDRMGNHDLSQTNPWGQPVFNAVGWNGTNPTISFAGHNVLLADWSGDPAGLDQPVTVLAVARSASNQDATLAGFAHYARADSVRCAFLPSGSASYATIGRDGDLRQLWSAPIDVSTIGHVFGWRYAPDNTLTVMVDSQIIPTTTQSFEAGWIYFTNLVVGARNMNPNGLFSGDISELVVVPTAISDDQMRKFRTYATTNWVGLP